jgi:IclR family transcriptional regulator, acetate operon repressor
MLRSMSQESITPTRATDRGLRLVTAVADHPDGLALAQLARLVDLSASTALRQLRALEISGFAAHRPDGQWVPGAELLRIARSLSATATLPRLAQATLDELSRLTGESAYLAEVVDASTAVYVAASPGTHAIRHVSWLGHRVPRRGTAVGSALAGCTDPDGVAVRGDAVESEVTAASAPVRGPTDHVVAAVSVVGLTTRMSGSRLVHIRQLLSEHAAEVSRLAGWDGSERTRRRRVAAHD